MGLEGRCLERRHRTFSIGASFDTLRSTDQGAIDRYVFHLMRKEAKEKRHLLGLNFGGGNPRWSRRARRVNVPADEPLAATIHGEFGRSVTQKGIPSVKQQAELLAQAFYVQGHEPAIDAKVIDISTTGCSFTCKLSRPPLPQRQLKLFLSSPGQIELKLTVRIIRAHVIPDPDRDDVVKT